MVRGRYVQGRWTASRGTGWWLPPIVLLGVLALIGIGAWLRSLLPTAPLGAKIALFALAVALVGLLVTGAVIKIRERGQR